MRFFICEHCKNIVTLIDDKGVPVFCCGQKMTELVANTTDAATEKHLPVVKVTDNKVIVNIGVIDHPMTEEHLIEWIAVETSNGFQMKYLHAGDAPSAEFDIANEEILNVYAYCNLHSLWKS